MLNNITTLNTQHFTLKMAETIEGKPNTDVT